MHSTPLGWRLAALIAGLALVASCTSGSSPTVDSTDRTVDSTLSEEPTPSEEAPTETTLLADEARLRACMESAGYAWEEVWPPWTSPEPPPEDSVFADPNLELTMQSCLVEAGVLEEPPFTDERIEQENREMLEYVQCMRERGWEVPDPEPMVDDPVHPGLLNFPVIEYGADEESQSQFFRDSTDCGIPAGPDDGDPDVHVPHGDG